jgi:hypothetical protein
MTVFSRAEWRLPRHQCFEEEIYTHVARHGNVPQPADDHVLSVVTPLQHRQHHFLFHHHLVDAFDLSQAEALQIRALQWFGAVAFGRAVSRIARRYKTIVQISTFR